ncbi:hypothetical protein CKF54_04675 [Psittacicella hinzii]|uniref:Protein-export protein SecB n=1 Tax=Psittacicella hinzii TaxID=2028575 RepID=A0A3A1Y4I0_9GAMM|nr:protein-export chaperone SecB [Psittacicella hinzii]RIY32475.1 hypothetical protein CKF54_04675 [Psittacicella hinzii]
MSEQQNTVELNILRVYTKDLSYVFNSNNLPVNASAEESAKATEVGFAVDVQVQDLGRDDLVDINVVLNLVIGDRNNPVVKFETVQGALFVCRGLPDQVKPQALYFDGAQTLWPFITNKLDKLLTRSGMPPLFLGTQNFRAIFQETLAQRQAQQAQ